MALIKCVECGQEISDMAIACPKCGKPKTKPEIRFTIHSWSVIILSVGLALTGIGLPIVLTGVKTIEWEDTSSAGLGFFLMAVGAIAVLISMVSLLYYIFAAYRKSKERKGS